METGVRDAVDAAVTMTLVFDAGPGSVTAAPASTDYRVDLVLREGAFVAALASPESGSPLPSVSNALSVPKIVDGDTVTVEVRCDQDAPLLLFPCRRRRRHCRRRRRRRSQLLFGAASTL